ncbi:RND efflux membrane fusion protein [Formosa agariphila KMM 3901]|uniref:RND efflux membrane fusion protein n=2 Tax=Formosa TaxID=225842 RepID=T2KL89_FORAG|nr:RND efflux membrane fusion protein [Formosa agariphila KMM 3901]
MFLPWTQNVSGRGFVTTLTPDQRPQTIQSPIPGRIEHWHVSEGQFVKKGDTLLHISEIKNEYQDPNLVARTNTQREAKSKSVLSYKEKINALDRQIAALKNEERLKLSQAKNKLEQSRFKVVSDSMDLEAIKNNYIITEGQFNRTKTLQSEGLKSVTDVEEKRVKLQESQAKLISAENKLLTSENNIINARIEINRISAEYADKIAKANSDKYTAETNQYDAEAQVSKLENQSTNYQMRSDLYYIKAPQDGYITKAIKGGIGETFKEGEQIVGIMPANYQLAVETYINPIDLPLLHIDDEVRIQFDGWPSIFFSGWPNTSYGTFAGKVVAIESFISPNGKFRVLIAPLTEEFPWPEKVSIGSGAYTFALLEDVPIWFELWRNLNGFPPNYYQPDQAKNSKDSKK